MVACQRNASNSDASSSSTEVVESVVPPFSTKEPSRYQATRIIIISEPEDGQANETVTKMLIAHDGAKRREEYANEVDSIVVLTMETRSYLLLPSKKLYADLSPGEPGLSGTQPESNPNFSSERLLNQTGISRYEKLGSVTLDGRMTTKYRVTSRDATSDNGVAATTLIWIDDLMGMPIRSETNSLDSDHSMKMTVELRDIKQEVDQRLFELPQDYKKVEYRHLRAEIP